MNDTELSIRFIADLEGNVKKEVETINSEIKKSKDSSDKFDKSLTSIGQTGQKVKRDLVALPTAMADKFSLASVKVKKLEQSIAGISRVSKYAFAGLAGSAGVAVKKYIDLESGILKVKTISQKSFQEIKKSAEDLSVKYGIAVEQITEGNYQLVSSMGDVREAQEILDTAAKLSTAGFTDYTNAMNGLVAVMNGYKMKATESGRVADILMTIQNRGITTVGELQGALGRVIPTASALGVKFEDLSAAMATITSNKIDTNNAVTYLNQALTELGKSGTQANKTFKEIAGTDFISFINSGHSLIDALSLLENQANKTGKNMLDLFSSSEAAKAVLNLTGENAKKFKDNLEAMGKTAGTTDKAMKGLEQGSEMAFKKLKEEVNRSVRAIGEALIPQVKELTDQISKVDWAKVFSQENINKIVSTGKNIGIVVGTVWTLHSAIKAINTLMATGEGIVKLFAWLRAGGAITAGTVGGIAALAMAGTALTAKGHSDVEKVVGAKENLEGKKYKEQLETLRNQIELTKKQIKTLKESNEEFENSFNITAMNTATKKLKELEEQYKNIVEERKKAIEAAANENLALPKTASNILENEVGKNNSIEKNKIIDEEKINAIKSLMQEYRDFSNNAPKFWDLIGLDEKERLEEKISFFRSALKKAVESGATSLIPKLKEEFDKASNELTLKIRHIDFQDAKQELENKLKELNGNSITTTGKTDKLTSSIAEYEAISKFLSVVKDATNKFEEETINAAKARQKELENNINAMEKEKQARDNFTNSMNQSINGINSLASSFSQLGQMTGSKTLSGIGGILGNVASLGSAFGTLKGAASVTGSLASVGQAGGWMSGAGLATIGTMATAAVAGVGIVMAGLSMANAKGKKKAAEIDAKNRANEEAYKKQVSAMEQLTQALMQNSARIKTFSDRMLVDISKNPTLRNILGGKENFVSVYDAMILGKHFNDISALEKGSSSYRKNFRKKSKDTFTNVNISEDKLLKYLGFDKTELDLFTDSEMRQLAGAIENIKHSDLVRATGRNLTQSNIEEWKKQVKEFVAQMDLIEREKKEFLRGTTLESFTGVEFKAEKDLIAEYTEQFKQMGLVGEQYSETIKEMARNNQVLITSMQDVRSSTIEGLFNGNGGFTNSIKSYFEKIFKNASSIAYDVAFSDIDRYFSDMFESISEKLVNIKAKGKLNFKGLFDGFDFGKLKIAEANEIQAKKSLDILKKELLNSGVDLSLINKILPLSDFNDRLNDLKNSLANAMNSGLENNSFTDFTKNLGQSLYGSVKSSLVKAFSESSIYQSMIEKFINVEDFKSKLEQAGSFKEAFNLSENILKKFGLELEANGFGGFEAINNKANIENKLGNAYYQDKASSVQINITNNFNREVYGLDDFKNIVLDTTEKGIRTFLDKPKVLGV